VWHCVEATCAHMNSYFALPRTGPLPDMPLMCGSAAVVESGGTLRRDLGRAVSLVGSTRTRRLGRSPSPVDRTVGRIARLVRGSA
jgi:hypothetical protein